MARSRPLRSLATLLVLGVAAKVLLDAVADWSLSDMDAYWNAALRLRAGEALYVSSYSVGAHDLYRYAPWFAYLWVPLTYLPRGLVAAVWEAVLLGATAAAVLPTLRLRTWSTTLFGVLMSAFLLWTVAKGNAQPLVVGAVVLSTRGRVGPLGIALAASLKAAPLAYVAVYVGRREWGRAAWTLVLTTALVLPMLFIDLSHYPFGPGLSYALFYLVSPGAWTAAVIVALFAAVWLARTRWAWTAGSIATLAAFPRLLAYDLSFLLVASGGSAAAPHPDLGRRSAKREEARRQRPRWVLPTILAWAVLLPVLLVGPEQRPEALLTVELVTDALENPVAVIGDPSDPDRLFVLERAGRMVLVDAGAVGGQPLLDLTDDVSSDALEQGLLGVALHPEFAENGRLFLYFTDRDARMVLLEFRMAADGSTVDPTSRREILAIPDPDPFHNGGQLAFGPDGYMYLGVGDGGELPGGWRDGRDPASLLGKILRLDVDAPAAPSLAYAVPADNPYVGVAGARAEVWAIGLRNPWRFAFDDPTGTLWIADVGQLKWEEVNALSWTDAVGANFGWNLMEGNDCFEAASCDRSGLVLPLAAYPHRFGNCAVIGGFVYHGPGSRLEGQYLLGDYCSGRIWTIGPGERAMVLQQDTDLLITSFGAGADGSAYITSQDGRLMRIVPTP